MLIVKNKITELFFMEHIYRGQFKSWTIDPNKAKIFNSISGIKNSLGRKINVGKPGHPCWKCVLPKVYEIVELDIYKALL